MPSPKSYLAYFLQQAHTYSVGVIIRWHWLAQAVEPLLAAGPLSVLDAGCGDGFYAFRLAQRYPQSSFRGVDLTAERVGWAQTRLAARPLANLSFASGDLTEPQGDALYDLIYSVDVFEHIADDRAALGSLAQALRPSGRLFIHTPLAPQRHWLRRFDLEHCGRDDHARAGYCVADLEEKARAAGLEPVAARFTHGCWGTLAWEIWMLVRDHLWSRIIAWPAIRLLVGIELARQPVWGNCVLFEAAKPTARR